MGVIRQFNCPSCGKEWKLRLGHGIRHGVLGRVMEAFSKDIQKNIVTDVDGGQFPLFDFNYQAAVCRQCCDVVAVPVLRMLESGQIFTGECPRCGGEAEILEEDSRIPCPRCGEDDLDIQDVGHWD